MKSLYAYMCGLSHSIELPNKHEATLFGTIRLLKRTLLCWEECGIVKVRVIKVKVIKSPKF